MTSFQARPDQPKEAGFTLIELMVVVMIIAILIAIAVPVFLGARERSQARATQQNLDTTLKVLKAAAINKGIPSGALNYHVLTVNEMNAEEKSLTFQTAASTGQTVISAQVYYVASGDYYRIMINAKANDDTCYTMFYIEKPANVGWPQDTHYRKSATCGANGSAGTGFTGTFNGWGQIP